MPKLDKKHQKQVADAPSGDFEPLDPGKYHARLASVKVSDKPGASGAHYWTWEYDVVEEPYVNRKLWNNTSLAEQAAFSFKQSFEAFGDRKSVV